MVQLLSCYGRSVESSSCSCKHQYHIAVTQSSCRSVPAGKAPSTSGSECSAVHEKALIACLWPVGNYVTKDIFCTVTILKAHVQLTRVIYNISSCISLHHNYLCRVKSLHYEVYTQNLQEPIYTVLHASDHTSAV